MKPFTQNPHLAQVEFMSRQEAYTMIPTCWMDVQKFTLTTGGLDVVMRETAAAFIEFMPGMLHDLETAVNSKDVAATGKILHKLKSSVSLLCNDVMSEEVRDLDRNAACVDSADFIHRINRLTLNIHHLITEVAQFTRI